MIRGRFHSPSLIASAAERWTVFTTRIIASSSATLWREKAKHSRYRPISSGLNDPPPPFFSFWQTKDVATSSHPPKKHKDGSRKLPAILIPCFSLLLSVWFRFPAIIFCTLFAWNSKGVWNIQVTIRDKRKRRKITSTRHTLNKHGELHEKTGRNFRNKTLRISKITIDYEKYRRHL